MERGGDEGMDAPRDADDEARDAAGWSARELADAAGTTIRTIHYYVAEGVLPPPRGERRAAVYPRAHLARLRLVAMLREEGLSLAAIRARMAALTDDQARTLADRMVNLLTQEDESVSILARFEAALSDFSGAREATSTAASERDTPTDGATAYVERLMAARRRNLRPSGPIIPHAAPAPAPAPAPASAPSAAGSDAQPPPMPTFAVYPPALAASQGVLPGFAAPETWHSLTLADGIDLRLRGDRYHALQLAASDPQRMARVQVALDGLRAALTDLDASSPSPPATPSEDPTST